jgi:hypothetical protein
MRIRAALPTKGRPGVDGQTFADIAAYGVGRWLDELAEELRKKTYQPAAVRLPSRGASSELKRVTISSGLGTP